MKHKQPKEKLDKWHEPEKMRCDDCGKMTRVWRMQTCHYCGKRLCHLCWNKHWHNDGYEDKA